MNESANATVSAPARRSAWAVLLPLAAYALVAGAFVRMALLIPSLAAACLFSTAAAVSLGAGVVLALSSWFFPQLAA